MLTNDDFVELVREHQAALRAYVRSLGVHPMWVDDVAQEVLVIAFERRETFDPELSFKNWVWGIARNCVMNERRKHARRSRILNDNITDILTATAGNIEEEAPQEHKHMNALIYCLSQLPEKSRNLLRMRYENNVKAADMAPKVDMKPAAIRKALERIRTAIRKCMELRIAEEAAKLRSSVDAGTWANSQPDPS